MRATDKRIRDAIMAQLADDFVVRTLQGRMTTAHLAGNLGIKKTVITRVAKQLEVEGKLCSSVEDASPFGNRNLRVKTRYWWLAVANGL